MDEVSFGIEEEYFLIHARTRDVVAELPESFLGECRRAFGGAFSQELFAGQVEIATPVLHCLREAQSFLLDGRQRLIDIAGRHEMELLCAGSHPLSSWEDVPLAASEHYRQLGDDYRLIARQSLLCGLHVHVGLPGQEDRIGALNAALPWLPFLLGLSASSPFWRGQDTGLKSFRRALCGEWPRMGMPPHLQDEAEYRRQAGRLCAAGALRSMGEIWWFIRPSARYPTLELRIMDACPRLADTLCLAGLFRSLLAAGVGRKHAATAERLEIEENYWRAQQQGCAGGFVEADRLIPATQILEHWPRAGDSEEWLRCRDHAAMILHQGCSADRQRETLRAAQATGADRGSAMQAVVAALVDETRAQEGLLPPIA
ncbi:Carboxylate-amine ligase YbdK [compost metagenome]